MPCSSSTFLFLLVVVVVDSVTCVATISSDDVLQTASSTAGHGLLNLTAGGDLNKSRLYRGDREPLKTAAANYSQAAAINADLMRKAEDIFDTVEEKVQDIKTNNELVDDLVRKVYGVNRQISESKASQTAALEATRDTSKILAALNNATADELSGLVGSVISNVSNSLNNVGRLVDEKWGELGSSLKKLPRQVGVKSGTKSLQKALAHLNDVKQSWYIGGIRGYLQNLTDTSHASQLVKVYSPLFVIAGYSARIVASFSATKSHEVWMGVFVTLCSGSDDSLLQWPFQTPFTLAIRHPKDPKKNVSFDVTSNDFEKGLREFKKPPRFEHGVISCNKPYGNYTVQTLQFLERNGFIENNAVTVSVTLHPIQIP